jgi:aryl-alcohol dehydrogenase-like predicted oxidoreductase
MKELADVGFTTFDGADHYGPAEILMGRLRKLYTGMQSPPVQLFTKWVPRPGYKSREDVEKAINRSLIRMETNCLDLVQFHWWGIVISPFPSSYVSLHSFSFFMSIDV